MLRYVLYAFLLWFLYKFIVGFVVPVYRATRDVKKKFRQMQEQMQNQGQSQNQNAQRQNPNTPPADPKKPAGEYIDFEEVQLREP